MLSEETPNSSVYNTKVREKMATDESLLNYFKKTKEIVFYFDNGLSNFLRILYILMKHLFVNTFLFTKAKYFFYKSRYCQNTDDG